MFDLELEVIYKVIECKSTLVALAGFLHDALNDSVIVTAPVTQN